MLFCLQNNMAGLNIDIANNVGTIKQSPVAKQVKLSDAAEPNSQTNWKSPQKFYACNLPALGVSFKGLALSKITDKAKIDENADKIIEKFYEFLSCKPSDEALQYTLKAISKDNFKIIEALTINLRTFDSKIEKLKNIIGQSNFESKFSPEFQQNYKKYLDKLWNDEKVSLEDMISLRPDWSFSKVQKKVDFKKPFTLGKLPESFGTAEEFNSLCNYLTMQAGKLKEETHNIPDFCVNNRTYKIKRFMDGMNKEGVFLVEENNKKYVIKTTKTSYIDSESIGDSSPDNAYPSRAVFVDSYLTNNNCLNTPKLYFYEFNPVQKRNRTIYEYIEANGDVNPVQCKLKDMEALKVSFNDTYGTNNILMQNGVPKCVDNDDSMVNIPLNLFVWGYNFVKASALSLFHL